eukprot:349651-Chlamydomonas_euryale.AAC.11
MVTKVGDFRVTRVGDFSVRISTGNLIVACPPNLAKKVHCPQAGMLLVSTTPAAPTPAAASQHRSMSPSPPLPLLATTSARPQEAPQAAPASSPQPPASSSTRRQRSRTPPTPVPHSSHILSTLASYVSGGGSIGRLGLRWPASQSVDVANAMSHLTKQP